MNPVLYVVAGPKKKTTLHLTPAPINRGTASHPWCTRQQEELVGWWMLPNLGGKKVGKKKM